MGFSTPGDSAKPADTRLYASTANLTANGNSGVIATRGITRAWLSCTVTGSTGTSPKLTIQFDQKDANGVWVTVAQLAEFTSAPNFASLTLGDALPLAEEARISWYVTGSGGPGFTGVSLSLIGE